MLINLYTFLFLIQLFLVVPFNLYGDKNPLSSNENFRLSISNDGFLGGKIFADLSQLNHEYPNSHGVFYTHLKPIINWPSIATTRLTTHIYNDELSVNSDFKVKFKPTIDLYLNLANLAITFEGGFLDTFTIGQGLTLKEFSRPGAHLFLKDSVVKIELGILSQGYSLFEDIIWSSVSYSNSTVRLEMSAFINYLHAYEDHPFNLNTYYCSEYFLPNILFITQWFSVHAEYALKLKQQQNTDSYIANINDITNAGLIGLKVNFKKKFFDLSFSTEARVYQKGFIPVTGVDQNSLVNIWDENRSIANWIDFFDSRDNSIWWYLTSKFETKPFYQMSLFLNEELLYVKTHQKEILITFPENLKTDVSGVILTYSPSKFYYNVGMKYKLKKHISLTVSLTNKMLNRPSYFINNNSSWGQRFLSTNLPIVDLRMCWNI